MRWRLLVAVGVIAFALFAIVTLPAQLVLSRFETAGVRAGGVSGTFWNGRAQALVVNGVRIGRVEWDVHALALPSGRLRADVKVTRVDGFVQTELTATPAGRLRFEDLTGSLPFSALPANAIPGGWAGTLNLKLATLVIEDGWPIAAEGVVEALNVVGPANNPVDRGSYKVTFPKAAGPQDVLTGALADLGGPLQVSGALTLKAADRSYLIEGLIAPRADASPEVVNALRFLGEPDAQGRRPFSTSGTL